MTIAGAAEVEVAGCEVGGVLGGVALAEVLRVALTDGRDVVALDFGEWTGAEGAFVAVELEYAVSLGFGGADVVVSEATVCSGGEILVLVEGGSPSSASAAAELRPS